MEQELVKPIVRNILVKQLWKAPVFTAFEAKLFFDFLPDYSQEKISCAFLGFQIMRPSEVPQLRYPWLTIKDDQLIEMRHWVYKARTTIHKNGDLTTWRKEVKKPCWSKHLSDQLIGYAKRHPAYTDGRLFSWTQRDSMQNIFKDIREKVKEGKLPSEYACFLDTNTYPLKGQSLTKYRLNLYALRRFGITFHYWVTFKQDIVKLAHHTGHANPKTLYEHYVFPKETIGLTQKMIDDNISIDQFIQLHGKKQTRIIEFMPQWKERFTPAGQTTLNDF